MKLTNAEKKEQMKCIKAWALKKMGKHIKKLKKYGKIYYGCPIDVVCMAEADNLAIELEDATTPITMEMF